MEQFWKTESENSLKNCTRTPVNYLVNFMLSLKKNLYPFPTEKNYERRNLLFNIT